MNAATDVNWDEIERLIARGVRGRASPDDTTILERAFRADPNRYKALHARIKQEAAEEINPLAKQRR